MGDFTSKISNSRLSTGKVNTSPMDSCVKKTSAAVVFSLFDTQGRVDDENQPVPDGIITKDEFKQVTKEEYENYLKKIKQGDEDEKNEQIGRIKNSIEQYVKEEGINDPAYQKGLEDKTLAKFQKENKPENLRPIGYDALKQYFKKNDSLSFEALKNAEENSNQLMDKLDKNNDGFISPTENDGSIKAKSAQSSDMLIGDYLKKYRESIEKH